jgi:steroid delta-isomerase-like uncharacterized protein
MSSTIASLDLDAFCARYVAAWNEHDRDAMAHLLTPDVVWSDPAVPGAVRGIPAVQEFMRGAYVAFPDLRFDEPEPRHLSAAGDDVAWRWRMRGTMLGPIEPPGFAPTGRAMEVEGVDLWTLRGGRIAVARAYYDMSEVARQLGIVPALESRAERAMVALQRLRARVLRRTRR